MDNCNNHYSSDYQYEATSSYEHESSANNSESHSSSVVEETQSMSHSKKKRDVDYYHEATRSKRETPNQSNGSNVLSASKSTALSNSSTTSVRGTNTSITTALNNDSMNGNYESSTFSSDQQEAMEEVLNMMYETSKYSFCAPTIITNTTAKMKM